MKRQLMTVGSLVLLGLLVGILTITEANADVEPNDNVTIAEEIGSGTHQGTLSNTDYSDYYKVEVESGKQVRVEGSIPRANAYDSVTILSCSSLGTPDDTVQLYLNFASAKDECQWNNEGSSKTFMYLYVSGQGSYMIRISYLDGAEKLSDICCNSSIMLLTIPLLLGVGSIIIVKRIRTSDLR